MSTKNTEFKFSQSEMKTMPAFRMMILSLRTHFTHENKNG